MSASTKPIPRIPTIAVLVGTSTSWGRRILTGVASYARQHGPWQLLMEARGMEEMPRLLPGWRPDGIIARVTSQATVVELQALNIPVVNISGVNLPNSPFPQVGNDAVASAKMAVEHFLDRGFQNFAYFTLMGLDYVATHQMAFAAAVTQSGHQCALYSIKTVAGAEPDWRLDWDKLTEWLRELPKPVGIFSWNASCSRQVLSACHAAGILVPEEVAILSGSDDDILCECVDVPISAVQVGAQQIGQQAAALLHNLMRGKSPPANPLWVAPFLGVIARQSTDIMAIRDPAIVKALSYIRNNCGTPIQISDVARYAGISRRVLERRFQALLNRTPLFEIRRAQLERAKLLLRETSLSIPDVAEASGVGSPEYFTNIFKAHTGQSPLKYRKEVCGDQRPL